jgi:hypothetical protein
MPFPRFVTGFEREIAGFRRPAQWIIPADAALSHQPMEVYACLN